MHDFLRGPRHTYSRFKSLRRELWKTRFPGGDTLREVMFYSEYPGKFDAIFATTLWYESEKNPRANLIVKPINNYIV